MRLIRSDNDLMDILVDQGAIKCGHFNLSSGLHSDLYVQCALALNNPQISEKIALFMIRQSANDIPFVALNGIEYVVSPAMGGIIIGHEVARHLGATFLFTERTDGVVEFRRGFELPKNARVVIVEDVVTTGKSTNEVIDLCLQQGARVFGVMSIINRSEKDINFGAPYTYGLKLSSNLYDYRDCPMCADGEVCVKPGSRR